MKFSVKISGIEKQSQVIIIKRKSIIPVGSEKEFFYRYEDKISKIIYTK